jgi:hypothetical protein
MISRLMGSPLANFATALLDKPVKFIRKEKNGVSSHENDAAKSGERPDAPSRQDVP